MTGFTDLLKSERGAFCIVVSLFAGVLVLVGKLDGQAWVDFEKWLAGALVASKTVTTAVETVALKKPQIPEPQIPQARVVSDSGKE